MPGLVAILNRHSKALNTERLLARMCQVVKHEGWYRTDTFADGQVGMGRVSLGILNPEPQPIFNEDNTLAIMMEGEIYDYEHLKKALAAKGHRFQVNNDPEFVLHLYEEYRDTFGSKLKELNGIFSFMICDNRLRRLIVCSDRYGFRPLFYASTNGRLLFASEIKAILQDETVDKVINDAAVSDFFQFGYLLGNKTLIDGIELLPPASILSCDADKTSIEQYWDIFDYPEDSGRKPSYYLDTFSDLFINAVQRCSRDTHRRRGASVSGGLDSRAVVACVKKEYYPISTFTFGERNCDDARFAQMVADSLGTEHHFYQIGPKDLIEYAEKAVWLSEGMLNCIDSHGISVLDERKRCHDIELCGLEGTFTWFNINQMPKLALDYSRNPNDKLLFGLMSLCRPVAKGVSKVDFLRQLFCDSYFGNIKKSLTESFDEVKRIVDSRLSRTSPFKRIDYYNLTQRQRRFSIYGPVITRSQIETRMPFFDKDVVDFVFGLPPQYRAEDKLLLTEGVLKRFPGLLAVPWQKTGLPLQTPKVIGKVYTRYRQGKARVNTILKKHGVRPLFKDSKRLANYDDWMRNNRELKEYILSTVLGKRTISRGYFNQDYLEKVVQDHMSGRADHALVIGLLLTFELFNRLFIDKGSQVVLTGSEFAGAKGK